MPRAWRRSGHDRCERADAAAGTIVVLNGTPRSGKSSIAAALQGSSDELWLNLGVDAFAAVTPARLRPGIGLRPGGERPDLEDAVVLLFDALYSAVVAWSRAGRNVVVDVGHHDDYSEPLGILIQDGRGVAGSAGVLRGRAVPGGGDHGAAGCGPGRRRRWRLRHDRARRVDPRRRRALGAGGARSRRVRPRGGHVDLVGGRLRRRHSAAGRRRGAGGVRGVGQGGWRRRCRRVTPVGRQCLLESVPWRWSGCSPATGQGRTHSWSTATWRPPSPRPPGTTRPPTSTARPFPRPPSPRRRTPRRWPPSSSSSPNRSSPGRTAASTAGTIWSCTGRSGPARSSTAWSRRTVPEGRRTTCA